MVTNNRPPGAPEGLVFSLRGNELEIVRRWFTARTVGRHLPGVFAIGFLVFLFYPSLREWRGPSDDPGTLYLVVPLAVIAVVFAYNLAAACLNRTCIVISRESLSVRHGPVPWPGNFEMAIGDIRFLHATHRMPVLNRRRHMVSKRTYEVHAYRKDGAIAKVVAGLEEGGQALLIKREMEQHSGLKSAHPNPQVVPQI